MIVNNHLTIIEGSSPQFTEVNVNLIRKIRDVVIVIVTVIIVLPPPSHPRDGHLTLLRNLTDLYSARHPLSKLITYYCKQFKEAEEHVQSVNV